MGEPISLAAAITAAFLVPLINDISGGRFGNLFSGRGFRSNYSLSLDRYNQEQKLNKDTFNRSQNFANINRRLRGGGSGRATSTRAGILSFLGDPSRKLDDAPDIVDENRSVLRGVSTLGGFFPFLNTRTPDIDNQKIVDAGFLGVRLEIDKINRNIDSIAAALAESAGFEEKYRKDMIDEMRKDLVEKGKDRSQTRSERSIFNLITRPVREIQRKTGTLGNELRNALLLSIGLESAAAFADGFKNLFGNEGGEGIEGGEGGEGTEGGEGGEGGENNEDTSNVGPKIGDYYFVKDSRGGKYYILQPSGNFKKVNRKPSSGKLFNKSDFNPVVEEIKNNNLSNNDQIESKDTIDGKKTSFLNSESSGFDITPPATIAMNTSGLEGRDRFTYIDMTTKGKGQNTDASSSDAAVTLDDSILTSDPSRGSIYELYVTDGAVV